MKRSLYVIFFSLILSLLLSCNEHANRMNFDTGNNQVTDHSDKILFNHSLDISKDYVVEWSKSGFLRGLSGLCGLLGVSDYRMEYELGARWAK